MSYADALFEAINDLDDVIDITQASSKYGITLKDELGYWRTSIDLLKDMASVYEREKSQKITSADEFTLIAKSVVAEYVKEEYVCAVDACHDDDIRVAIVAFSKIGNNMSATLCVSGFRSLRFKIEYDYNTDQFSFEEYIRKNRDFNIRKISLNDKPKARVRRVNG